MKISEKLKNQLHKILIEDEIEAISVVNPKIYEENIAKFKKVLEKNRLKYAIHSVLKVNHSNILLETALKNGLRADVSSIGELEQALKVGFTGENITANGPKNTKFLRKCLEEDVTIVVDSIEEIEKLAIMSEWREKKVKILVRLWAFKWATNTRFGIAVWLWKASISLLEKHKNIFSVEGIHFHIDIPDVRTRISIFWEAISYYQLLLRAKFSPKIFNIGGSYGTNYENNISQNLVNKNETLGTNHKMYSAHEYAGVDFLRYFLEENGKWKFPNIATFLRENNITLWIEPGRSIFSENVGFVATSILGTREDSIIINTNSFSLGMREEELPTNPFLIDDDNFEKKFPYWILGNLCLESDMIYSRAVPFGKKAKENDIIIFPNMAAYHMDFYETESISHPKKVKYFQDENDNLFLDNYNEIK